MAYSSATGVTKQAAQVLAKAANADLYEIKPAVPYTKADLSWMDEKARSTVEMSDQASRPAMADKDVDIENYSIIFLGFPIWWYVAPTMINTFLESYDFSGKKIVLFATSGGSGFGNTMEKLKGSISPTAEIVEGRLLNGRLSESDLTAWLADFGCCKISRCVATGGPRKSVWERERYRRKTRSSAIRSVCLRFFQRVD